MFFPIDTRKTAVVALTFVVLIAGVGAIAFFSLAAFYITASAITVACYTAAYLVRRYRAPRHRETQRQSPVS